MFKFDSPTTRFCHCCLVNVVARLDRQLQSPHCVTVVCGGGKRERGGVGTLYDMVAHLNAQIN